MSEEAYGIDWGPQEEGVHGTVPDFGDDSVGEELDLFDDGDTESVVADSHALTGKERGHGGSAVEFVFSAGDRVIQEQFSIKYFAELPAEERVLYALGLLSSINTVNVSELEFVGRIVNKGVVNGSRLHGAQIGTLVVGALRAGHVVRDGDGKLHLTDAARPLVDRRGLEFEREKAVEQANRRPEVVFVPEYTAPTPLPELFDSSEIPPSIRPLTKERHTEIAGLKLRQLEPLAAFAKMNGCITDSRPDLKVRSILGAKGDARVYRRNLEALVETGYLERREEVVDGTKTIIHTLTEGGIELIADIRANPSLIAGKSPQEHTQPEAMYRLVALFAAEVDGEPGVWIRPRDSSVPIDTDDYATTLGVNKESFRKIFCASRAEKGYLEVMKDREGRVCNVRLTSRGPAYLQRVEEGELQSLPADEREIPDEAAVRELELRTRACIKFAEQFGWRHVVEELADSETRRHPLELTMGEFTAAVATVNEYLRRLARAEAARERRAVAKSRQAQLDSATS